jgi:hypothetical protein
VDSPLLKCLDLTVSVLLLCSSGLTNPFSRLLGKYFAGAEGSYGQRKRAPSNHLSAAFVASSQESFG